MLNPRLAGRYAKSLIDLSLEKGKLESVHAEMQWLNDACKSSREFVALLKSPIIKGDKKIKILEAVTAGKVGEIVAGFNRLLIKKGRESVLPEIAVAFLSQYKVHKGINTVKLATASPISESTRNAIMEQVRKSVGYENIELEEKVNEDLIGGFVLQIGDKLIDASIAYDLRTLAKQFENNDFVYKVR
jgi:F-type H+-transporting ATPase subunit delta